MTSNHRTKSPRSSRNKVPAFAPLSPSAIPSTAKPLHIRSVSPRREMRRSKLTMKAVQRVPLPDLYSNDKGPVSPLNSPPLSNNNNSGNSPIERKLNRRSELLKAMSRERRTSLPNLYSNLKYKQLKAPDLKGINKKDPAAPITTLQEATLQMWREQHLQGTTVSSLLKDLDSSESCLGNLDKDELTVTKSNPQTTNKSVVSSNLHRDEELNSKLDRILGGVTGTLVEF